MCSAVEAVPRLLQRTAQLPQPTTPADKNSQILGSNLNEAPPGIGWARPPGKQRIWTTSPTNKTWEYRAETPFNIKFYSPDFPKLPTLLPASKYVFFTFCIFFSVAPFFFLGVNFRATVVNFRFSEYCSASVVRNGISEKSLWLFLFLLFLAQFIPKRIFRK